VPLSAAEHDSNATAPVALTAVPALARGGGALRVLWWPLAWLGLQLQLLLLGLMSMTWNLVALLLYPLLPRDVGLRVGRKMISWGYGLFWRIARCSGMLRLDASALDVLRDERGLVVVANHPSLLDAVMLVARLPRSACIMKASLSRNPLLGPGARLARYIRNDSTYGMVHCAVQDLRAGGQLVLFPEGTRTVRVPINKFQSSFTLIAKRAQVPIQTVFIDTQSPYLGKGWPLWRLPPLPIVFSVRLGERFAPATAAQDAHTQREEIEAYFAAQVQPLPHLPPSEL
jgi:1-acyl-sn-glycerol-3-phosphate acyltransferase